MNIVRAQALMTLLLCLSATGWAMPSAGTVEVEVKGPPAKSVKGDVVRQNLREIVLQEDGKDTVLAWADVVSVNGRAVRDHVEGLKESLKDVLCPDCRGGRVRVSCPECLGEGTFYFARRSCTACQGTGNSEITCKAKGCEEGKIKCPGRCLKRSEGVWKPLGRLACARVFYFKTEKGVGSAGWSENHVGEVFDFKVVAPFALPQCTKCKGVAKSPCRDCRNAGTFVEKVPVSQGPCPTCVNSPVGKSWIPCVPCAGAGRLPCKTCLGSKSIRDPGSASPCNSCKAGVLPCAACAGAGIRDPKAAAKRTKPPWSEDLQKALQHLGEGPFVPTDQVTFQEGRGVEGRLLHKMDGGLILATAPPSEYDIPVMVILNKHVFRHEARPGPAAKEPAANPPAAPAPSSPDPDTVVLKDGTTLKGKIVMRSEEAILLKAADGKTTKIETEKIAEIRKEGMEPE